MISGPEARDGKRDFTVHLRAEEFDQTLLPPYAVGTLTTRGTEVAVGINVVGNPGTATLNTVYSQATRGTDENQIVYSNDRCGEDPAKTMGDAMKREKPPGLALNHLVAFKDLAAEEVEAARCEQAARTEEFLEETRELYAQSLDRGMHLERPLDRRRVAG